MMDTVIIPDSLDNIVSDGILYLVRIHTGFENRIEGWNPLLQPGCRPVYDLWAFT